MNFLDSTSCEETTEKERECSDKTYVESHRLKKWLKQLGIASSPADYLEVSTVYEQQRSIARARLQWVQANEVDDPLSSRKVTAFEQETKILLEIDLPRTSLLRDERTLQYSDLFDVLYTWAHFHTDLGYRQGMNELSAFCGLVVRSGLEAEQMALLPSLTYALFSRLLAGDLQPYYQFKEGPKQLPLNRKITHIYRRLVRARDPELYKHLEKARLEPSICLVRWIRLLFLREATEETALQLWDFYIENINLKCNVNIESNTVSVDIIDVISVALWISARKKLMQAESESAVIEELQAIKCDKFSTFKDICDQIISLLNRRHERK